MHPVNLNIAELDNGAHCGLRRHLSAIKRDMKRPDGTIPSWGEDIEGAAAERAYAKLTGRYWPSSVDAFDEADVGDVGVRWTVRRDGCLILRKRDFERYGDDATYALVTGQRGVYIVEGQIRLGDARREEWLQNPHGWGWAYFIPISALGEVT